MKIGNWKMAHSWMTRPDTMPPKERAALEAKQAKAEADRKNKKRAEYGLPPLKDKFENEVIAKTKELAEDKITTKQRPFNPQELKPGSSLDDVARNMLIEESKARDLSSEEIQYLMTDEYYRNKKPSKKPALPALKDRPVRKPAAVPPKTKTIKVNPNSLGLDFSMPSPTYKPDPELEAAKRNIENMIQESKEEKIKNMNSGIGYLAGGIKAYE
jgi:hypothetical protein